MQGPGYLNPAPSSLGDEKPPAPFISIQGRHFVDELGRVVMLRGVNVSGASKVPSSDPNVDIEDPTQASYINRPFSLEDAPTHWRRLKRWGLGFLRITVTWEAIEHAGPGIYDMEYLDYLKALLESMTSHGLIGYVCLHQDLFSRLSGGSGAPAWTLTAAGFDLSNSCQKLEDTGAAYMGGRWSRVKNIEGERGLWPTGYTKLAVATMNTLFWGGKIFAPKHMVQDPTAPPGSAKVNVQDFLQDRFLKMFEMLVDAVGGVEGVIGFEMMNEPHHGYIGLPTLHKYNYNTDLHLGPSPSPIQSFSLASGHPTSVPIYTRSFPFPTRITSHSLLNPSSARAWVGECVWEREGVWKWDAEAGKAVVLKEGYFGKHPGGGKVDFYKDCYWPFVKRWEGLVKGLTAKYGEAGKGKILLVEGVPNEFCPDWPLDVRPENLVFAPHWYDLKTMFEKSFGSMTVNVQGLSRGMFIWNAIYFGAEGAKNNYKKQVGTIVQKAYEKLGEVPVVMGETGCPMDLNGEQAFRDGNFKWHEQMLDALLSAYESSLIGYNLWTYSPQNTDLLGDIWNSENFSWYSDDRAKTALYDRMLTRGEGDGKGKVGLKGLSEEELDLGGRMLDYIVRPYAVRTAGIPITTSYSVAHRTFSLTFANLKKPKPLDAEEEYKPIELPMVSGDLTTTVVSQVYAVALANMGKKGAAVKGKSKLEFPPLDEHCALSTNITEIFLPASFVTAHAQGKLKIAVTDGHVAIDAANQKVLYFHRDQTQGAEHTVKVYVTGFEKARWVEGVPWVFLITILVMLGAYGAKIILRGGFVL